MTKADIVQLQENGEPKYVATHANAVEGLSDFIQKDYERLGNTRKIYVSESRGDNSLATGEKDHPYRTIQAAVDSLPMISGTEFYIFIEAGVYLEDVVVENMRSGRLEISSTKVEEEDPHGSNTSVMLRSIRFEDCGMYCRIRGITLTDPQNFTFSAFISFIRCSYGAIDKCRAVVNTKSINEYCGAIFDGSTGSTYSSFFSNQNCAIKAQFCANVRVTSGVSGTGNDTALWARESTIYLGGQNVTGTTEQKKQYGGRIFS